MTRTELVDLIREAGGSSSDLEPKFAAFIEDASDIRIRDLNIDSLVVLEICIGLEEKHGISITVHDFKRLAKLTDLMKLSK